MQKIAVAILFSLCAPTNVSANLNPTDIHDAVGFSLGYQIQPDFVIPAECVGPITAPFFGRAIELFQKNTNNYSGLSAALSEMAKCAREHNKNKRSTP